jgi:hypothetical protein
MSTYTRKNSHLKNFTKLPKTDRVPRSRYVYVGVSMPNKIRVHIPTCEGTRALCEDMHKKAIFAKLDTHDPKIITILRKLGGAVK